jgi:hypothetical protein
MRDLEIVTRATEFFHCNSYLAVISTVSSSPYDVTSTPAQASANIKKGTSKLITFGCFKASYKARLTTGSIKKNYRKPIVNISQV